LDTLSRFNGFSGGGSLEKPLETVASTEAL